VRAGGELLAGRGLPEKRYRALA